MGSVEAWGFFLAAAFGAEVVGTMAGFGAATILTPIAFLFMDAKAAVAMVAGFHLLGNLSRLRFFGRSIHWPTVWQFGATGIAASFLGARVTSSLPSSTLKALFGGFLLVYVAGSALAGPRIRLPSHWATLIGGGLFSGFIAGLLGTGGAIRSVCLLAFGLEQTAYLGTSAMLAVLVDGTRLPVYIAGHFLPPRFLPVLLTLVPVAFAGAWTGQRLVRRLSGAAFRALVMTLLALMGVKLLWEGAHGGG